MKSEKAKIFLNDVKKYFDENKSLVVVKKTNHEIFNDLVKTNDTNGLEKYLKKIGKEKNTILYHHLMDAPSEPFLKIILKSLSDQNITMLQPSLKENTKVAVYLLPLINENYNSLLEYFIENFINKKTTKLINQKTDLEALKYLVGESYGLIKPSITFDYLNMFEPKSALAYLSRLDIFLNSPKDCLEQKLASKIERDSYKYYKSHTVFQMYQAFVFKELKNIFKKLTVDERLELVHKLKYNYNFSEMTDEWYTNPRHNLAVDALGYVKKYISSLINPEKPDDNLKKGFVRKIGDILCIDYDTIKKEIETQALKMDLVENNAKKIKLL